MSQGLSLADRIAKRSFDLLMAAVGIVLTWWLMVITWAAASIDTRKNGLFLQERVGRHGKIFSILKIRTMRDLPSNGPSSHVTTSSDPRITRLGRFLRRTKLDELPQLFNVLAGQMSFVGPRPDVPGYADELEGDDRIILSVRPGVTGPATVAYRREEDLLAQHDAPERYNKEVLYPKKVRINREYVENYRFRDDLLIIIRTLFN